MSFASHSRAGVWGMEPSVGVAGDYASNPALLNLPHTAEGHGALLLDAPVIYNGDAFKVSLFPSFRFGTGGGYSSLDSDYQHFNAKGEFDAERSVFTASAGVTRDSSVYYNYLLNGGAGVRRDAATADLSWDRYLTARTDFNIEVNSTEVRYGEPPAGTPTLIDYSYTSVISALGWNATERSRFTASAAVGRYSSRDDTTRSNNVNLQLGYVRQLDELWTLTATAGYSHAVNKADETVEFLEFTPEGPEIVRVSQTFSSAQNGSVYSVNLTRQANLLTMTFAASRQLIPTGFAYLSRQNSLVVAAHYPIFERWTLGADASWSRYQNPPIARATGDTDVTTGYFSLSAACQWTERWTVTMGASRVIDKSSSASFQLSSNSVSIKASYKFNRISF